MIISYKKKIIFMHSRKTAGSSITVLLNKNIGPKDIQIGSWIDSLKSGGMYNQKAIAIASHEIINILRKSLKLSFHKKKMVLDHHYINYFIKKYAEKKYGLKNGGHCTAKEVKNFAGKYWSEYFKFAFVRNPWDHAVSDFHWQTKSRKCNSVNFKEFLYRLDDPKREDKEKLRPPIITNWSIYTINDSIAVDFLGRYENLVEDLNKIGDKIGINLNIKDVRSKSGIRPPKKRLIDHYDEETIELVRKIYKKEIEEFGYELPF